MAVEIKVYDKRFSELFDPEQEFEMIADFAGVAGASTNEGPVWHHKDQCLYFNNIRASRTWSYSVEKGLQPAFNNGTMSNGMFVNRDGRLIICEHATSSLVIRNTDGSKRKVLADYYGDIELNSPNDVIARSDGLIYFTDPVSGRVEHPGGVGRPYPSDKRPVYALNLDTGTLIQVADGFGTPNGLCFSPDEKILYVNDTPAQNVRAYDVRPDGTLFNERLFAELDGRPDGMKADALGNIVIAEQGAGLSWYSPKGERLGFIFVPNIATTNLTWGDSDFMSLYITCRTCVYKLRTLVAGLITPLQDKK